MENERDRRPERRQYFRHQYPLAKRPTVEIEGRPCQILDICERGLRIEKPPEAAFEEGTKVDVTVRFAGRDELALSGEIVHMEGSHVGILLSEAIPLADVFRD